MGARVVVALAILFACGLIAPTGWAMQADGAAPRASVRPLDQLLPDTAVAAVLTNDLEKAIARADKTQIGELMNSPPMEIFRKDLRRQIDERWATIEERIGLTLEDMRQIPGGEVAVAVVRPARNAVAHLVLADVSGHEDRVAEMIRRVDRTMSGRNARRSERTIAGTTVTVYEVPPIEEPARTVGNARAAQPATSTAAYAVSGELLLASDDLRILEETLRRHLGGAAGSLAAFKPYSAAMQRCQRDAQNQAPDVRWFLQPLYYAETIRTLTPEEERRKGRSRVEMLESQGFRAILGVGGYVTFSPAEGVEMLHRTAVYAPPPYEKSMKMLSLPNGSDFQPPAWVPADVATFTSLYFDVVNAFDNFGPLFDDLFGQGDKGVWDDVKDSMRLDPNGPQIDLRRELIQYLGPRVMIVSDYKLPITTTSERLLFAVEAKDAKAVEAGIRKIMQNDLSAHERKIGGRVVWEIVEEQGDLPPVPVVALPTISTPGQSAPKHGAKEPGQQAEPRLLPHAAVTVAEGYLLCASHIDFLEHVLAGMGQPQASLADDPSYRRVDSAVHKLDFPQMSARVFSFTDREYQATYELARENKMPESETMLARVLNSFSPSAKRGQLRKPQFDGRQLPDFDVVRRSLGPAGTACASEADGWFIKGFTLTRP